MKHLKYTGIADTRIIQHADLGDAEIVFLGGETKEVDDATAANLQRLCPGEFAEVEAPAQPEPLAQEQLTIGDAPDSGEEKADEEPQSEASDAGKGKPKGKKD